MKSYLVEPGLGEFGGPLGTERDAGVHVQVELRAEFGLQPPNPLKCPLSCHQGIATGDSSTCGTHCPRLLDDLVKTLTATLVGEHVIDVAAGL